MFFRKDYLTIIRGATVYIKNQELHKNLLKFAEITAIFIFSLNNKKYSQISINLNTEFSEFISDFYEYIDLNDNFILSILPSNIIKNIFQIVQFVR